MKARNLPSVTEPFLLTALFLSGADGLVLEIIFRRQLLLALGLSHYSVATVLTIFMAGLAVGSFLFGRLADKTRHPMRLYGFLEIGVGLSGILVVLFLPVLNPLYVRLYRMFADPGSQNIFIRSAFAGPILLIPTILMGGTLPVAGKILTKGKPSYGSRLGLIYGVNTLGGVVGVLGATFWILALLGARRTLVFISVTNILVGLAAAMIFGKKVQIEKEVNAPLHTNSRVFASWSERATVAAFFISGFSALSLEVHWTRILAYVVGSHGYAFGIILAAFLSGIGLGSLLISRFVERFDHALRVLAITQCLIGLAALGASMAMFKLRGLTGWLTVYAQGSWNYFIVAEMTVLFLLVLIPTVLMGAVFPLVMKALNKENRILGVSVGFSYAMNTLGSILGAFMAGFVFIPYLGISDGLRLTFSTSLIAGIIVLYLSHRRLAFRITSIFVGLLIGTFLWTAPLGNPLQAVGMDERLIFYKESSSATVAVREDGEGARMLSINGLDEVPVDPASLLTFRMLAHLPLLMHNDPRHVMVLSLGGAITTGSVARHPVKEIDAVELCSTVVHAAKLFRSWNHGVMDDARLRVIVQDGRNHLLTSDKVYDVITADATHPWSADSWILYTKEMYELVSARLADDGIFCQWIPLHWMSQDDFKCILRTLRTVFPELSLWYTGSYVAAVASMIPMAVNHEKLLEQMEQVRIRQDLAAVGINSPVSLLALHLISGESLDHFVGQGPVNTDDLAYLEHSAARCFGRETTPENLLALANLRSMPTHLFSKDTLGTKPDFVEKLERIFRAREKTIMGRIATYEGHFSDAVNHYQTALEETPEDGVTSIFLKDALSTLAILWANKGDQSRQSGEMTQAMEAYEQALKLDASESKAHNGIGLIHFARGDYRRALTHFEFALKRRNKQPQIRYNRALALLKLGRVTEARTEMAEIQKLDPGQTSHYLIQLKRLIPNS